MSLEWQDTFSGAARHLLPKSTELSERTVEIPIVFSTAAEYPFPFLISEALGTEPVPAAFQL